MLRYWPVLAVFILFGCSSGLPKKTVRPELPVTISIINEQKIPADFENVGVLSSPHQIEVRARVTGYLDKIAFTEGAIVNKGELLYQIDPRPFEADLDQQKAVLAQEEARLWDAKRAYERLKPLYEKNAVSQRDLDNATSRKLSSEAAVEKAKAGVRQAELNLEYTTIRAPVSGVIGESNVRVGDLIAQSLPDALAIISVVDPIWADFSISENEMLSIRKERNSGALVLPKKNKFVINLILADETVYDESGVLNFASPTYDSKTGTMLMRATFSNPKNDLRPGQFVRARVQGACRPNAIIVPKKSVQQGRNGMYVYTLTKENKVEMRLVGVGVWYKQYWIIESGLQQGDRVIVDGVNKVLPGIKVKPEPVSG